MATICGTEGDLDALKQRIRRIAANYGDRLTRTRRIFLQEPSQASALTNDIAYDIRQKISEKLNVPFNAVKFCGSAHLGFSVEKDKLFTTRTSDLDIACIDVHLFQKCWEDIITTTRAFSDPTPFSPRRDRDIDLFIEQLYRRGMIRLEMMPRSTLSRFYTSIESSLSTKYRELFSKVSIAVYMNEYAFCWKQDSSISDLVKAP